MLSEKKSFLEPTSTLGIANNAAFPLTELSLIPFLLYSCLMQVALRCFCSDILKSWLVT